MSDETILAIIAIVVSGVVGPSVAARWALKHQRERHRHERELAD
jgi:hypothetical protein